MTGARAQKDPKVAELTDLYRDGEPREGSLERPANVALPYLR
jgi:hypothetical protein